MSMTRIMPLAMAVWFAAAATTVVSAEPQGDPKPENPLIGTWKYVSANPGSRTTVKHITPTQFMWVSYNKDGEVTRAAGGYYTLKGDVYEETPEYGLGSDFAAVRGKTHQFKWRIEGNKWYHEGTLSNGQPLKEVWERVEKK